MFARVRENQGRVTKDVHGSFDEPHAAGHSTPVGQTGGVVGKASNTGRPSPSQPDDEHRFNALSGLALSLRGRQSTTNSGWIDSEAPIWPMRVDLYFSSWHAEEYGTMIKGEIGRLGHAPGSTSRIVCESDEYESNGCRPSAVGVAVDSARGVWPQPFANTNDEASRAAMQRILTIASFPNPDPYRNGQHPFIDKSVA
jgi:hypothetical protein